MSNLNDLAVKLNHDLYAHSAATQDSAAFVLRKIALNTAFKIVHELQGPEEQFLQLAYSATDTANIAILVRLGIFGLVPPNGSISAASLAEATALPHTILVRVLRYSISNGLFLEPDLNRFAHSQMSRYVAENPHIIDIASIATRELATINIALAEALGTQSRDGRASVNALDVAYPGYKDAFHFISSNADLSHRYHRYLAGRTLTPLWDIKHLLQAWDWETNIGEGTLVDLGGSSGHTCRALAAICPRAHFVIQDIDPAGLEQGRKLALAAGADIAARMRFVQHDLFSPNTESGRVYLFRHILHDWADEDVVRLVQNLLPCLIRGAKVLVSEGLMPDSPAQFTGSLSEKQIRLEDMFMLSVHGACERSVGDFVSLFETASTRLKFVGITGGQNGAFQSLLEFEVVE